ncbi:MAG TPA: sugar phosphate isomerase/epimerase family protein [Chloroflexota bacterium]|jgi:sugar phosphate isomerase/epimerase|nr:sugar phosphate isomerase/epimerase family protein [Chloroflexota bacterium]
MRIGYSTWSMKTTPWQVFLPALHEIGYTAIALDVSPGGGRRPAANDLATLTPDDRRRLKQECEQRGIAIDAVMGHRNMLSRDADEARAHLQGLKDTIDFCLEVCPRGQHLPTMTSTAGGRPSSYEADKALLLERVGELTEYARSRGVVFGLEVHANTAVSTPDRIDEVLGAIDSPFCRLDYDGSHFEVQLIPMEQVIPRVLPWTVTVDIKDQRVRYADEPMPDGWRIEGNGIDRTQSPDGRSVEWQWVIGGEGGFELPKFLRLMHQHGWKGAICYELSVQVQQRPDFDPLGAAAQTYRWMAEGWKEAGVPTD